MIELLLQAERALAMGLVDQAERLYAQAVAADPRNSIAVVGLARVALERADDGEAYRQARQALEIDAENAAAARLVGRLEEVYAARGLPVPGPAEDRPQAPTPSAVEPTAPEASPAPGPSQAGRPPAADPGSGPSQAGRPPAPEASPTPGLSPARRSLFDRLLRRNHP